MQYLYLSLCSFLIVNVLMFTATLHVVFQGYIQVLNVVEGSIEYVLSFIYRSFLDGAAGEKKTVDKALVLLSFVYNTQTKKSRKYP